jgi:hypothetical protein
MEAASRALVQRRYFDCERLCVEAMERAYVASDYERMSRILMPLEEARRQKRDLALDTRAVYTVLGAIPAGRRLRPGCYLVAPPRVGIDGRLLREAANKKKVPVIVVVREPDSRDGKWPVVSIGPVTIRTKVDPAKASVTQNGRSNRGKRAATRPAPGAEMPVPPPEWFITASEAIGDKALAGVDPTTPAPARVEMLFKCLQAHPDHEKLHQALADACREAAKQPLKTARARPPRPPNEFQEE